MSPLDRVFDNLPDSGIFDNTAWGSIDTTGWIKGDYGKDQLHAILPAYKASDACPIACGTKGSAKSTDLSAKLSDQDAVPVKVPTLVAICVVTRRG